MNIGRSFSYMFEDKGWVGKTLLGSLISAVPILNFAVYGYQQAVIEQVMKSEDLPLPSWSDLGKHWSRGAKVFLALLVYSLPILILMCVGLGLSIGSIMAIIEASNTGNSDMIDPTMVFAILGSFGIILCPILLYNLVLGFFTPGIYINMAREESHSIGSGLRVGEIFGIIKGNTSNYFMAILVTILAGLASGVVSGAFNFINQIFSGLMGNGEDASMILIGIMVIFITIQVAVSLIVSFWASLVASHSYGQVIETSSVATPPTTETV